jgi:hypothetical protein
MNRTDGPGRAERMNECPPAVVIPACARVPESDQRLGVNVSHACLPSESTLTPLAEGRVDPSMNKMKTNPGVVLCVADRSELITDERNQRDLCVARKGRRYHIFSVSKFFFETGNNNTRNQMLFPFCSIAVSGFCRWFRYVFLLSKSPLCVLGHSCFGSEDICAKAVDGHMSGHRQAKLGWKLQNLIHSDTSISLKLGWRLINYSNLYCYYKKFNRIYYFIILDI